MKGIILNADDFGPSEFINRGIIRGIEHGVVNSVSVLVTFGKQNLKNIEQLHKKYGDRIKIGLHLSLTAGSPVHSPASQVASICSVTKTSSKTGKTRRKRMLLDFKKMELKKIDSNQVLLEIKAQLNLLAGILGGIDKIDHINSHHNIFYFYKPFWKPLHALLSQYKIPTRSPLSAKHKNKLPAPYAKAPLLPIEKYAIGQAFFQFFKNPHTPIRLLKEAKTNLLINKETEAKNFGIGMPDYYISHYYGQPSVENIDLILDHISEGETVELMLHLGYNRDKKERLWGIDKGYYYMREKELESLISSDIIRKMEQKGITLCGYPSMETPQLTEYKNT